MSILSSFEKGGNLFFAHGDKCLTSRQDGVLSLAMSLNNKNLGPLAPLAGIWEGDKGDDIAPDENRGKENNKYRERIEFVPVGLIENHEQKLYGLRYRTTAWRYGEEEPFHEELGYWLWDHNENQVIRSFIIPRGVTILAGGTAGKDAHSFHISAEAGSDTYGICSNKFLDREFKTVRYELKVDVHDENNFSYEEDTQLQIRGQDKIFHHTDSNTLKRVESEPDD